jgi:hypothetical protein
MQNYKKSITDLSIYELLQIGELTRDALLVCKGAGITFLSEIIEEHHFKFGYQNIRNCGRKKNAVLMAIYDKYRYYDIRPSLDRLNEHFSIELGNLSSAKTSILQKELELGMSSLSARSSTVLRHAMDSDPEKPILSFILDKSFDFLKLRNVGALTVIELEELRLKLIRLLNKLKASPDVGLL